MYGLSEYQSLRLARQDGAMWVTIDHPPLNVLDAVLMPELDDLARRAAGDAALHVIVFQSADPDFFIAHGSMHFANQPETLMNLRLGDVGTEHLNPMMRLHERLRALPQITIGKLAGLARGGGAELLSALDMRFAAKGKAALAQMEALVGIIPGAGGTVYLPQLIGRSRALEVIVGAALFDADQAERYGWVNRALPPDELDGLVDDLARRIAERAPGMARAAKRAVNAAAPDLRDALTINQMLLVETFSAPAATTLTNAALAKGAQTRDGERDLEGLLADLPRQF